MTKTKIKPVTVTNNESISRNKFLRSFNFFSRVTLENGCFKVLCFEKASKHKIGLEVDWI